MKNQDNQKIIQTKNGALLISKGLDDNQDLCVHYSTVFEHEEMFIDVKASLSYKNTTDRDKGYNITNATAENLFNSLLNQVEKALGS